MSPVCVCEVLAQNIPQTFLYSKLKLTLFEDAKKGCCPFKCKWAVAPSTEGGATTVCVNTFTSHRHLKMSMFMYKPESDNNGETQEEVTTYNATGHFW